MQEAKEAWAGGVFTANTLEQTAIGNIAAVENVKFAEKLIAMDYEDYLSQMKDGE